MEETDFSFDHTRERRGTGSLKWDLYEDRCLPFWVADMDFDSPQEVIDAVSARGAHGVFGYALPKTSERDAVVNYLRQRHGVNCNASWLVWLAGLVPALSVASAVANTKGVKSSLTCTPVYPPFLKCPADGGLETIYVSLAEDASGHYSFDREALEAAVRPDTGLFILCNPHNPVGRVYTREELEWLGDFCLRHDLLFCSDEVHCDLILDEESTPHISLLHLDPEIRDRSIVLMSASKTYNIAGIGCAFALIPDSKLRTAFRRAMGGWVPPVNVFGYTATEAAFCHGEPWRKALLVHLRNQHQILADYLSAHHPEVRLTKAEATYLAWTDVRGLGIAEPAAHFQKHGIALSNGADFGASGYLRWNLGCSSSMLEEGLRRFTDGCQTVH